jgi:acetyl esterase/lipase
MKTSIRNLALAAGLILAPAATPAQNLSGPDFGRMPEGPPPPPLVPTTIRYAPKRDRTIDYLKPQAGALAPLIVTLGGATESGPTQWAEYRFLKQGFAVADVNYVIGDGDTLADAAADVAKAIAVLVEQHRKRDFDPERIVLLGYGRGGLLATLLATDPTYLSAAGVPFETLRAAASVNSDAFDIAGALKEVPGHLTGWFRRTYGKEPALQESLSPVNHLEPPNVPNFLFLAAEDEPRLRRQAETAAALFSAAGLTARYKRCRSGGRTTLKPTFSSRKAGLAGRSSTSSKAQRLHRPHARQGLEALEDCRLDMTVDRHEGDRLPARRLAAQIEGADVHARLA